MGEILMNLFLRNLLLSSLTITITLINLILFAPYINTYLCAAREISACANEVDFIIQENKYYESDTRINLASLDDRSRIGKISREIQTCALDLTRELNRLLGEKDEGGDYHMLFSMRMLLWICRKKYIKERITRLDRLSTRIMILLLSCKGSVQRPDSTPTSQRVQDEKHDLLRPSRQPEFALKHMSTQATGYINSTVYGHHQTHQQSHNQSQSVSGGVRGWAGVVAELQNSPRMHKRRTSSEIQIGSSQ